VSSDRLRLAAAALKIIGVSQGLALSSEGVNTEQALALFDSLAPAAIDSMRGAWRGEGLPTGHPLDGALEAYHWAGKRFDSDEDVHPLVFATWAGALSLRPAWLAPFLPLVMRWPWLKSQPFAALARAGLPLLATGRSKARLRLVQFRGELTATMVYDEVPIQDVFRQLAGDAVLGLMDCKGMERPYFFVLRRERSSPTSP
jgi:hypothetical protein